jgi:hypothetical protein
MHTARHNPEVPENAPPSTNGVVPCPSLWEELHTALDIIRAAAANLRHYRDRLTSHDYTAAVRDIEQAAEQISHGLTTENSTLLTAVASGKRRPR